MTALVALLLTAAPAPTLTLQPEAPVPGGVLVVEVNGVDDPGVLSGEVGSEKLRFFTAGPHHQRALMGIRLEQKVGDLPVTVRVKGEAKQTLRAAAHVQHKEFRKSKLTVDNKFVSPPKEVQEQIEADHKAVAEAYAVEFGPALFPGKLSPPRDAEITAHFGDQRIYNKKKKNSHYGTDFDGKTGDPIQSAADGTVVMARPCYYSGNTVIVNHGGGLFTSYFHMSRMDVKAGDHVGRGQQLGLVGKTGRVTGPHLHLGVKIFERLVDAEEAFKLELGLDAPAAAGVTTATASTGSTPPADGGTAQ